MKNWTQSYFQNSQDGIGHYVMISSKSKVNRWMSYSTWTPEVLCRVCRDLQDVYTRVQQPFPSGRSLQQASFSRPPLEGVSSRRGGWTTLCSWQPLVESWKKNFLILIAHLHWKVCIHATKTNSWYQMLPRLIANFNSVSQCTWR